MLSVLGGVIAVPYFYHRVDEEIRRQVEARLAEHYQDLAVSVRFAKLVEGEGIEIRGLSILEPGQSAAGAELVYIDELFLRCDTRLLDLMSGDIAVQHITIRRPRLRVERRADVGWNTLKLLPLPQLSEHPADVTIENGSIELADANTDETRLLTIRDVSLSVDRDTLPAPGSAGLPAPVSGPQQTTGNAALPPGASSAMSGKTQPDSLLAAEDLVRIRGHMTGDHLQRIEIDAVIAPKQGAWAVGGTVDGLDFSPEFRAALPVDLQQRLAHLASLRAKANLGFRVYYDQHQSPACQFEVTGRLGRGRIDDPRLPYPLTDLFATFRADHRGFSIDDLTARNGQTTLLLTCRRDGYQPDSPLQLTAHSRQMTIDRRLFDTLPLEWRSVWDKFYPAGVVDLDCRLTFDGADWKPQLTVRCLDASFLFYKFPYRLERGTGTLQLDGSKLLIDLTAFGASGETHITGEIEHPGPDFTGHVDIDARNVPFDDKLFAALPEKPRAVIRSLHPRGTFDCFFRCWRDAGEGEAIHKRLWGHVRGCSLRYDKFPYPLDDINGQLEMTDDNWEFRNLTGTNDTGVVTCNGTFRHGELGGDLRLNFTAAALPLDEELRDSLDPRGQNTWQMLRPRGQVNLPWCDVRYLSQQKHLEVSFRLEPHGESTSIEPAHFPYRLERLRGAILVRQGHLEIEQLSAVHGRTAISARGSSDCSRDGKWQLRLEQLTVDRLAADRDLITALPERLRRTVQALQPTGPLNLQGSIHLEAGEQPGSPPKAAWNLHLEMGPSDLNAGVALRDLRGGIRLVGSFDGRQTQCHGELDIDSVMYRDYQFTQVRGPLFFDDQRLLLGAWARPDDPPARRRRITAQLYGGTLAGDCWVTLEPVPRYSVQATLAEADLARFTQETIAGKQQLRGKAFANVVLRGEGPGLHTLKGSGNLQLRDADIYELPLMVSLLSILFVKPPDTTAFTESDVQFRVDGGHVYFDRITFAGDAISLRGSGEMNLASEIRLQLYAAVGRTELGIPLVREMMRGASQEFMLIHVGGTLNAPVTRAEAFPGVSKAFKDLEAGLQGNPQRRSP